MPGSNKKPARTVPSRNPLKSRSGLILFMIFITGVTIAIWFWRDPANRPIVADPTASASPVNQFGPEVVDLDRVRGLPGELDHPVYWAGQKPDTDYELTVAQDGAVGLRYLPAGAGDRTQKVLTVATFPKADAYTGLQGSTPAPGHRATVTPSGALVVVEDSNPQVGYLALPDLPYLVQVYAPAGQSVWSLLSSDKIVPIPTGEPAASSSNPA